MNLPDYIRPGAIVRLKAGNRARIYAIDGKADYPIHGAIELDGEWTASSWREDLTWSNVDAVGACWTIVGPDRPDYSALWPLLPPWVRFLARDENGNLWAYSEEPILIESDGEWAAAEGASYPCRIPDSHCPPPVGDWRESLAERPAP